MRRRLLPTACLLVVPLIATACKQLSSGAREDFAARYSCPEDRVEVKPRADLQPAQVLRRANDASAEPPDEVRRDPGRYAKWQKDQADRREARASTYIGYEVLEVSGCGHTDLLVCHHPGGVASPGPSGPRHRLQRRWRACKTSSPACSFFMGSRVT